MERHDDSEISGDILLLRRIPPAGDRVAWDEQGIPRASTGNFRDGNDELSLYLASETNGDEVLAGHNGFGLIQITAQQIREACGPSVILCRDLEEPAMGHVLVCGKVTKSAAKKLQRDAVWVEGRWPTRHPPDPPENPSEQIP